MYATATDCAVTPHPGPPPQGGRVRRDGVEAHHEDTWEGCADDCRTKQHYDHRHLFFLSSKMGCGEVAYQPRRKDSAGTYSNDDRKGHQYSNALAVSLPPPLRGRAGVGGLVEQAKFAQNRCDHTIEVLADFPVPASKHPIAPGLEPSRSPGVGHRVSCLTVVDAVYLDNEVSIQTDKVHDVWTDRMLSAESQSHASAFTQVTPKDALLIGHIFSQSTCVEVWHRGEGPSGNRTVN